jgi:putative hydrolase
MSELPFDPQDLGAMLQRLGAMLQSDEPGPVPWRMVRESALEQVRSDPDEDPVAAVRSDYADADRLARLWLDNATVLPDDGAPLQTWTRRAWIEQCLDGWQPLVDPLAERATGALGEATAESAPGLGGVAPGVDLGALLGGPMGDMLKKMGGAMVAAQIGQGVAELSRSVVSTADLAVPLGSQVAVVPHNVDAFGSGLGVAESDVRLHVVLRTLAHHRLVMHAPWLAGRFASAVAEYAHGITIDLSGMTDLVGGFDPRDPASLQRALDNGMFQPPETPEQQAALKRLHTLIALVDGWLDDVVAQAGSVMPDAARLEEATRRRRAAGGPAEQAFASLVGLELRPRRQRDAAALWAMLREERGAAGRDALWNHPDLLPTDDDLDDPAAFLAVGDIDWTALEAGGDTDQSPDSPTGDSSDESHGDGSATD